MPNEFDIAKEIWASRPKPLSSLFRGTVRGAPWGAAAGAMVGGAPGAVAGAGIGAALGTITTAAQSVTERLRRLADVTQLVVDRYKAFNPAIARMHHQWVMLDRRLSKMWADTLAPTLRKLTDIGTEFKTRWERMKVNFFDAIEPYLQRTLDFLRMTGRGAFFVLEKLVKVIGDILNGLTKVLRWLGLMPEAEERGPTKKLKPFPVEWPTIEGPLSGAMRRVGAMGPPFTQEARPADRRRGDKDTEDDEEKSGLERFLPSTAPAGLLLKLGLQLLESTREKKKKEAGQGDVKVEVKVGDSKELSAVFEQAWRRAIYEVRKLEAEETLTAFTLQQQGTFV